MKQLAAAAFVVVAAVGAEVDVKGALGLNSEQYGFVANGKHNDNLTLTERIEMDYAEGNLRTKGCLYAQQDLYDMTGSASNGRSFLRIDELYGAYDYDKTTLSAGKMVRYWGALEARNIVDVFNTQDGRNEPFTTDKLGTWQASWAKYTQTGEITLIAKLAEEDQLMAYSPYVYNLFPKTFSYDEKLATENSRYRPTIYLLISGTSSGSVPLDYGIVMQHGYDSQRFIAVKPGSLQLQSHAYTVNKVMGYATMVDGATLYKAEALYTDVIDQPKISDYMHTGVGIEHTLEQAMGNSDVGLIVEYYRYHRFENTAYSDLELYEVFQNDLFAGVRFNANDDKDTSVIVGVVADLAYDEQNFYAEYTTRLGEVFRLNADIRYINPSEKYDTAFAKLGRHERFGIKLSYHF